MAEAPSAWNRSATMHTTLFDRGGGRDSVLVDHVLVERLGHQLLGVRIHPGRAGRSARFSRLLPSSISSSWMKRYSVVGILYIRRACAARELAPSPAARCRPGRSAGHECACATWQVLSCRCSYFGLLRCSATRVGRVRLMWVLPAFGCGLKGLAARLAWTSLAAD